MHPLISLLLANDDDLSARLGVIDFRPVALYRQRHIRASLHIEGPNGLRHRFSWLPPPGNGNGSRGRPLIVICQAGDEVELRSLLERWNVIDVILEGDDEEFWSSATADQEGNLVVDGNHKYHDDDDDVPALLFQPSPLIEAALQAVEAGKEQECCSSSSAPAAGATATVLDLGCGAGRDLAWIVRRKKRESSNDHVRWLATGIDNLLAVIERARLLRDDYKLNKEIGPPLSSSSSSSSSHIECLLWAQASTDTGSLQALHLSPTSKTRGIIDKDQKSNTSLADFAALHLPRTTYDLILFIRFLPLPLLQNITQLTHNKSIIAISHFTTLDESSNEPDYSSPDRSKRFEETHISMLLQSWGPAWRVLLHTIHRSEDGRPLRSVLFQRS